MPNPFISETYEPPKIFDNKYFHFRVLEDEIAYSVFNKSKNKCLGSVYIDPSDSPHFQCVVHLWIRNDSIELDNELFQTVRKWLSEEWHFSNAAFPGRCISWEDWADELKFV